MAPDPVRIERIRVRFQCDERRAEQMLKQNDHDRKGFHDYFFNVDWNNADNFDLVINTGKEHPTTIAEVVNTLKKLLITEENEKACLKRLGELQIGQEIVTEIIYKRRIPIHFLEADIRGTQVTLHGVANTQGAIDSAGVAAMERPDIEVVENAIQIVQEFAVMP